MGVVQGKKCRVRGRKHIITIHYIIHVISHMVTCVIKTTSSECLMDGSRCLCFFSFLFFVVVVVVVVVVAFLNFLKGRLFTTRLL